MLRSYFFGNKFIFDNSFVLICLIILGSILTACDDNKAEQEAMRNILSQKKQQFYEMKSHRMSFEENLSDYDLRIVDNQQKIAELRHKQSNNESEFYAYVNEHKAASTALLAVGSGVAVLGSEEIAALVDDTSGRGSSELVVVASVVGTGYCLIRASECTEVVTTFGAYQEASNDIKNDISYSEELIRNLQTNKDGLQQSLIQLDIEIDGLEKDISDTENRLAELGGLFSKNL